MRQIILPFFFVFLFFFIGWQTGLFVCYSEYYFKLDHACLRLSLWLAGNTRELISFAGSGCNGFIPQDLITVRCPMCVGFKRPPARLSVCQLGLWGGLSSTSPTPRAPKHIGVPITVSSAAQRTTCLPCLFYFCLI